MRHFRRVISLARVFRSHSLAICGVVVFVVAMAIVWWLPIPAELQRPPIGTLTLLDCRGREIAELASPEARAQFPVTLEKMGPWLPRVTVALEDQRFYEHRGIDWHAIAAACTRNLRSRHLLSGASTITQQLVKLATGRERRSWSEKTLRSDHRVEARTPMEQGTNSRRIFESQQLWQSANRAGSGCSSILRQTGARPDVERSSFSLRFAASANAIQSVATSRPSKPEIQSVARPACRAGSHHARSTIVTGIATENRAHRAAASCATLCRCRGRPDPGIAGYSDCNARSGFADDNRTLGSLAFIGVESARYQAGRCGRC